MQEWDWNKLLPYGENCRVPCVDVALRGRSSILSGNPGRKTGSVIDTILEDVRSRYTSLGQQGRTSADVQRSSGDASVGLDSPLSGAPPSTDMFVFKGDSAGQPLVRTFDFSFQNPYERHYGLEEVTPGMDSAAYYEQFWIANPSKEQSLIIGAMKVNSYHDEEDRRGTFARPYPDLSTLDPFDPFLDCLPFTDYGSYLQNPATGHGPSVAGTTPGGWNDPPTSVMSY
ncbi:hypothetical protein QFC22_005664 [Naganishia vaughanmartiniae]|uniref:Uncharacterized protein n=1 Tax=Naganishia vaughanmartiniae TaxID=1424756 RepID=A0ACC2WUJ6_9TREE|nr:hypothetical protein QFC22_005664 [Naganishia vaughanmartiniae]